MTKNNEQVWLNFTADDLSEKQAELFKAMIIAKEAFEASFPVKDGYVLRFSYKGADFSRMGVTEVAKPKDKAAVATSLSAWIAARREANLKH